MRVVYVDRLTNNLWRLRGRLIHNCHMIADTEEELIAFAIKIGMKPEWIQKEPGKLTHFDLTPGRRAVAVKAGAIEIDRKQMYEFIKKAKAQASSVPIIPKECIKKDTSTGPSQPF